LMLIGPIHVPSDLHNKLSKELPLAQGISFDVIQKPLSIESGHWLAVGMSCRERHRRSAGATGTRKKTC
jgi:hypothetical protein